MGNELNDEDLLLLNALVDGELAPAQRAVIAARLAVDRDLARAHATLARLKAAIGETAGDIAADISSISLPPKKPALLPRIGITAAGIVAILTLSFFLKVELPFKQEPVTSLAEGPTAITLAALPAGTSVLRLDTAGLKLIGLAIDPGKVPLFIATYRGPHGCRLDLRAWPVGAATPPLSGTDRYSWIAGDLVYELVAHGMPKTRFAIIAGAAELQTRAGSDHDRIDRRLREASIGAPPCVG